MRISLSAGRDSRAILALCRTLVEEAPEKVTAFTTLREDVWSRVDVATAAKLAGRAGIRHEIAEAKSRAVSDEDVARAFIRFGEAKWGPVLRSAAASAPRAGGSRNVHLPGMAGELARGFYWRDRMPDVPKTFTAAAEWLEGLPASLRSRPMDVLDLLYLEQRMGCWDAPARYLFRGAGTTLNLMSTSVGLDAMLRLDPAARLRGTFQQTLGERAWPLLADLPYNRPSGRQRISAAAWRGRDIAARIGRRLRAEAISALARDRS